MAGRVAAFAAGAAFWCAGCTGAPPLRLAQRGSEVTIDVRTLGEYQTTVGRIRLTDVAERRVVWEIVAASGTPQIHKLTLSTGANPARLASKQAEGYRVVTPAGDSFLLESGRRYLVEVWGAHTDGRPASGTFQLDKRDGG